MKALAEMIRDHSRFAIISHVAPDGDTLGSASALIYALEKLGKQCQWFCDGEIPASYMRFEELQRLTQLPKIKKFDAVIAVDTSEYGRLGSCSALFDRIPIKAQVDHHMTNTGFADFNIMKPYPATGLIILELLDELNVPLDLHIASALYIAVTTDTGRLSYQEVDAFTVEQTARLYGAGAPVYELTRKLFNLRSFQKTKLIGEALHKLYLAEDGKVACILLEQSDYLRCGAGSGDTEGIIDYAIQVEGVQIAVMLRNQSEGIYKGSLRCLSPYNVARISQVLGGGGHQFAAGFTVTGSGEEAMQTALAAIKTELEADGI